MDKDFYKKEYLKLKETLGRKPKVKEFYEVENVTKRQFIKAFGNNPYSKLQAECGDTPNKLNLERTPTEQIYKQFGKVVRQLGKLPTQADWFFFDCRPTVSGIEKSPHNIKWTELPKLFLDYAQDNSEWIDVIKILDVHIPSDLKSQNKRINKEFENSLKKIGNWRPQRKRFNEEGYKIELRGFLQENNFIVEEEKGDSNIDLLVNKNVAIELKKDPSRAEYDRLFGQIARHLMIYKYLIVVICDISNEDRYKQFLNTIDFVYSKLNVNLKIIGK